MNAKDLELTPEEIDEAKLSDTRPVDELKRKFTMGFSTKRVITEDEKRVAHAATLKAVKEVSVAWLTISATNEYWRFPALLTELIKELEK